MTPAVSRETPPPPPAAASVFGPTLDRAVDFAELLASSAVDRGLIGPREVPRLWDRHLLNCAVVAPTLDTDATVADVGSGAGLPGIVWAIGRPDLAVTLVEPMLRRVRFLEETVEALALENVTILRTRAEEIHGHRTYDIVAARALAPLDRLASWCLPLVGPGGSLIALKGDSASRELAAAVSTLTRLGATECRIENYGEDVLEVPTRAVVMSVASRTAARLPESDPGGGHPR